jgi:hypothetical protein
LEIRQKTWPEKRALSTGAPPIRHDDADRIIGCAFYQTEAANDAVPFNAAIQLLDLADIGAVSSRPGQTLRVFGDLAGTTRVSGDDRILPAGHFSGVTLRGGVRWTNNELYLGAFSIDDEQRTHSFSVVVTAQEGAL